MTEPLKTVSPGRPLAIPASTWNAFVEIARAHRAAKAGMSGGAQVEPQPTAAGIVLVRNDSGSGQSQFAVLGVDAPIILPADNEREFRRCVALSCVTPQTGVHDGRFVILLEPLASGAIGRAAAAGVTPVRLAVTDEDDAALAEVTDASSAHLTAGAAGSATVLWRAGGTGEQWALVRFGGDTGVTGVTDDGTNVATGRVPIGSSDGSITVTVTDGLNGTVDVTVAAPAGTDHGGLDGLGDDDHPQYVLADGSRAFAGTQSMGSHKLTDLADGVAAGDAVNAGQLTAGLAAKAAANHDHDFKAGLEADLDGQGNGAVAFDDEANALSTSLPTSASDVWRLDASAGTGLKWGAPLAPVYDGTPGTYEAGAFWIQ